MSCPECGAITFVQHMCAICDRKAFGKTYADLAKESMTSTTVLSDPDCAHCDSGCCDGCASDDSPVSASRDTLPVKEEYVRCAELGQALVGLESVRRYLEGDVRGTVAELVASEFESERLFRAEIREQLRTINANLSLLVQSIRPLGQRLALVEGEVARLTTELSEPPSVRAVGSG